jgi:hypothetical protein
VFERHPEPIGIDRHPTARKIGRRALIAALLAVSVATGAAGGYGLDVLIEDVLAPGLQHIENDMLDDAFETPQP